DGNEGDKFGTSVSLYGNSVIIGSPRDGLGSAYVYNLNEIITATEESASPNPTRFRLSQNYPNPFNPNPFNPETTISYSIAETEYVELKVYNVLGELVGMLENRVHTPGEYESSFDASGLATGIYFYRLTAREFSKTLKMVVAK
ncbi:MAG: T9SS type A sorting domain-containing protein, partial [Bacteroidetes bacterium]|nr:T9SS type A sorting domain-containing protein [Bacteroidota bacterium]